MNNLSSTAKKLDKVFEIAHSVLGALAIAAAVFLILIPAAYFLGLSPEFIGTGYETLDVGFLELEVADIYAPDKWLVLLRVWILLIPAGVSLLIGRKGIVCIRAILQPMTAGQPFDNAVSTNLKQLAKLSIILGIAYNCIMLAEQIITAYVFDVPGLLISEKIVHVSSMFEVDLTFLVCWAAFLLLSYVFRYGEQLQQLSDETL